jgi:hypothetical protein
MFLYFSLSIVFFGKNVISINFVIVQNCKKLDITYYILYSRISANQWLHDKKDRVSTSIMGLAYVEALCDDHWSCILAEGREGFRSAHLLVHEFGHVLVLMNQ